MQVVRIPKKNGKFRTIYMPDEEEKTLIDQFFHAVSEAAAIADTDNVAHGFRNGRSSVTNALQHAGPWRFTLCMDLKDFFDTVTPDHCWTLRVGQVRWRPNDRHLAFCRGYRGDRDNLPSSGLPLNNPLSGGLILFPDGAARQGLRTSPALSNYAAAPMDEQIMQLLRHHDESFGEQDRFGMRGFVYTRYADDLTFSFNRPSIGYMLLEEVPTIAWRNGFDVNKDKTTWQMASYGRRIITGVAVDGTGRVYPTRDSRRTLRAIDHSLKHRFSKRAIRKLVGRWQSVHDKEYSGGIPSIRLMAHNQGDGLAEWCRLKTPEGYALDRLAARRHVNTPAARAVERAATSTMEAIGSFTSLFTRRINLD